ncbi:VanZ family protein [Floricoccus penangensis]|uniref:VanZ family protein n=1 Tax=Floricoccus penangensis TaxID=1859475 RepID=UPI0020417072|nr:VanZ family protein [Floricoccus penangensis]URZ88418.1 VanZ family protein [Floricoccus penangensis]
MNKVLKNILIFLACILISLVAFRIYIYELSMRIIPRFVTDNDLWINLLIIVAFAFLLYTIIQIILLKYIPKWTVVILYIFYFMFLFYALFLKNIGVRGFDLDPFNTLTYIEYGEIVSILNIFMLVPLGFIVKLNWKNLLLVILSITAVEICQYVFSLGIFDTGDIITNVLGYIIGALIAMCPLGKKVKSYIK